ncbi:MAG TPA: hypothetical protein DIS79_10655 [Bacteroidetes bacterium]|nr:hypothetical protein [Bacteroidota bacterium]
MNRTFLVGTIILLIGLTATMQASDSSVVMPRVVDLDTLVSEKTIDVTPYLVYSTADDVALATSRFDSTWRKVEIGTLGEGIVMIPHWRGIGWFRGILRSSSSSRRLSLSINFFHAGASELYVDGRHVRSFGTIVDSSHHTSYNPQREIVVLDPWLFRSDTPTYHHIAVRFAAEPLRADLGTSAGIGFNMSVGRTESIVSSMISSISKFDYSSLIPLGMVIGLGLLHLLLYVFDGRETVHIFYVAYAVIFCGIDVGWHVTMTATSTSTIVFAGIILNVFWVLVFSVALLLITQVFYGRISRRRWLVVGAATFIVFIVAFIVHGMATWLWALWIVLCTLEVGRITFTSMGKGQEGAWIIGLGLLLFTAYVLTWFTTVYNNFFSIPEWSWRVLFVVGLVSMPLSITVFMARRITGVNRSLRDQVTRNEELLAEKLVHERRVVEEEMRRSQLELEHERKTRELEEARKLQMSMLPTTMPKSSMVRVAMAMHTATEVGGDYFDYYVHADDHVTIAIGDATGHGLKAGVMVATAKSHFQTNAKAVSHEDILRMTSDGIRKLQLRGLYMCMGLLTVNGRTASWTAAGIPPVLHVAADGVVTSHLVKGLPLGSPSSTAYETTSFDVQPGDSIVMLTDGLPELFDPRYRTLGMATIEECVARHAASSAHEMVSALIDLAEEWRGEQSYNDDVTVVVVRIAETMPPNVT